METSPPNIDVPVLSFARRRAAILRARGITTVIDVGANIGQYATLLRTSGFDGRIISFEPLSAVFPKLKSRCANDPDWEVHRLALSDHDGRVSFNVSGDSISSSLLPMDARQIEFSPTKRYVATEIVDARCLDGLWPTLVSAGERIYLKLDVQGAELAVLAGGLAAVSEIDMLELEASLVPLYAGAPLFDEIFRYLSALGFSARSLECAWDDQQSGEMRQVDVIFARE